jgi:hypothetical protein
MSRGIGARQMLGPLLMATDAAVMREVLEVLLAG